MDIIYLAEEQPLVDLADAIRGKTNRTEGLTWREMKDAIDRIESVEDTSAALVDGSLTEYENSALTRIGSCAFAYCSNLTSVNLPSCISIDGDAFYSCTSLTSVSFPACTSIGYSAFYNCTSLTSVSLPACTSIGRSAFYKCSSLTTANFPACTEIGLRAFNGCTNLTNLYLTASSVTALKSVDAFYSTPMSLSTYTGDFGSIYVPASLVASYQISTNWVTYSSRIVSIAE